MALDTPTTTSGTLVNRPTNDLNRLVAMIIGGVLLLVGILGFFWDPVLNAFDVDPVHNVIHLLTGGALLAAAFANNGTYARTVNLVLGVTYLIVALLGFVAPGVLGAIMAVNAADHWLHLALGVVLTGVAFAQRTHANRPVGGAIR